MKKCGLWLLICGFTLCACTSVPPSQDVEIFTFAADEMDLAYFQPLVKEFNQGSPDARVILIPFDYGVEMGDPAALAAFADTFLLPEGQAITSGPGSYVLDLQPLIESDSTVDSEDFWPGALGACRDEEGHALGIPLSLKRSAFSNGRRSSWQQRPSTRLLRLAGQRQPSSLLGMD